MFLVTKVDRRIVLSLEEVEPRLHDLLETASRVVAICKSLLKVTS